MERDWEERFRAAGLDWALWTIYGVLLTAAAWAAFAVPFIAIPVDALAVIAYFGWKRPRPRYLAPILIASGLALTVVAMFVYAALLRNNL